MMELLYVRKFNERAKMWRKVTTTGEIWRLSTWVIVEDGNSNKDFDPRFSDEKTLYENGSENFDWYTKSNGGPRQNHQS